MPDPITTPATETKPDEQTTPPEGAAGAGEGEGAGQSGDPKTEEVPAEVLRQKLTEANAEAANYRTKLREAQDALGKAKTPEEFEAATSDLNQKIAELERNLIVTSVATEFKLPPELAKVLSGEDEAALKAHAKELAKFVVVPATPDPSELDGGLSPGGADPDAGLSPRELAKKHARRR